MIILGLILDGHIPDLLQTFLPKVQTMKHKTIEHRLINISLLFLVFFFAVNCVQQIESPVQNYIELSAEEAFDLIQDNEGNPDLHQY